MSRGPTRRLFSLEISFFGGIFRLFCVKLGKQPRLQPAKQTAQCHTPMQFNLTPCSTLRCVQWVQFHEIANDCYIKILACDEKFVEWAPLDSLLTADRSDPSKNERFSTRLMQSRGPGWHWSSIHNNQEPYSLPLSPRLTIQKRLCFRHICYNVRTSEFIPGNARHRNCDTDISTITVLPELVGRRL